MFGFTMLINYQGTRLLMRAPTKEEMPLLVQGLGSRHIQKHTSAICARTKEDENEWYEKNRVSTDSVTWFLIPNEQNQPVGVTSLGGIDLFGSCMSGIIIWEDKWWGKGIATRAHLGRTLYAADHLNRLKIDSTVEVGNHGSYKALQRVGYSLWGTEPKHTYRFGKWIDLYHLIWIHPEKANLLFPEGIPKLFEEGLNKARLALALAREIVEFV